MSLTIEKQEAKMLYPEAPEWMKKKLIEEFGEEITKQNDFENIKTFEDACKVIGIKPESVCSKTDLPDEAAYKKLKVIAKAVNGGWMPDWNNTNQQKWFPWFKLSSGFGFSLSYYYYGYTYTNAGSRLCFESEEKSTYCAQQFIDLYKEFITITY